MHTLEFIYISISTYITGMPQGKLLTQPCVVMSCVAQLPNERDTANADEQETDILRINIYMHIYINIYIYINIIDKMKKK